jgi:hypothetical protein
MKIVAYCIWFGIVLWVACCESSISIFAILFRLPTRIGIYSPAFGITAAVIPWFCFICLLAWLPVWLMKRNQSGSTRLIGTAATFLTLFLLCTILNAVIWQEFVTDKLYNCTDSGGFLDYLLPVLNPGDWWLHGNIAFVHQIVGGRSMSEPDTIKEGWSMTSLRGLWFSFITASVVISACLTFLIWRPRKTKPTISSAIP